jgi:hypothetical protein
MTAPDESVEFPKKARPRASRKRSRIVERSFVYLSLGLDVRLNCPPSDGRHAADASPPVRRGEATAP